MAKARTATNMTAHRQYIIRLYAFLLLSLPYFAGCDADCWQQIDITMKFVGELRDAWGVDGSHVYFAGQQILEYENGDWSMHDFLSESNLYIMGIWGSSVDNIYAVSNLMAVNKYDGNQWEIIDGLPLERYKDVWGSEENDVHVVGGYEDEGGVILHYQDGLWQDLSNGLDAELNGVWGTGSDNVFAVGGRMVTWKLYYSVIMHYDGTSWKEMDYNGTGRLHAVWGASEHEVFAVGSSGTVLFYNGSNWGRLNPGVDTTLVGVWGRSATDVFVVEHETGKVLHYDGHDWKSEKICGGYCELEGIWGAPDGELFIVGTKWFDYYPHGVVFRYTCE